MGSPEQEAGDALKTYQRNIFDSSLTCLAGQ